MAGLHHGDFPVRLAGRFIPDFILIPVKVVVSLGIISAVVTGTPQIFGKAANMFRQPDFGPHMVCTNGNRILRGNDSGTARRTHSMAGKGVGVAHSLGCQLVQIRSRCHEVAVTSQMRADVFTADPQDIWAFRGTMYRVRTDE